MSDVVNVINFCAAASTVQYAITVWRGIVAFVCVEYTCVTCSACVGNFDVILRLYACRMYIYVYIVTPVFNAYISSCRPCFAEKASRAGDSLPCNFASICSRVPPPNRRARQSMKQSSLAISESHVHF